MHLAQQYALNFAVSIPHGEGKTLEQERLEQAMVVNNALEKLLKGELDIEQFLDCIEPVIGTRNMDAYIKEVTANLDIPLEHPIDLRGESSPLILP